MVEDAVCLSRGKSARSLHVSTHGSPDLHGAALPCLDSKMQALHATLAGLVMPQPLPAGSALLAYQGSVASSSLTHWGVLHHLHSLLNYFCRTAFPSSVSLLILLDTSMLGKPTCWAACNNLMPVLEVATTSSSAGTSACQGNLRPVQGPASNPGPIEALAVCIRELWDVSVPDPNLCNFLADEQQPKLKLDPAKPVMFVGTFQVRRGRACGTRSTRMALTEAWPGSRLSVQGIVLRIPIILQQQLCAPAYCHGSLYADCIWHSITRFAQRLVPVYPHIGCLRELRSRQTPGRTMLPKLQQKLPELKLSDSLVRASLPCAQRSYWKLPVRCRTLKTHWGPCSGSC